jgi:subtilisin family serine protease
MSLTHRRGRSALAVSSIATASVAAAMAVVPLSLVSPAAATAAGSGTQGYIVQLAAAPLASYAGGTKGLAATKPQAGKKVDTTGPAAQAYEAHLKAQRDAAMRSAGVTPSRATKTYDVAFSGFTASLTADEAARLEKTPGVLNVWKDEMRTADTVSTPTFLGLEGATGVWQQKFGGSDHAGEGMIIGVIDSGIGPESASFAALSEPRPDAATIASKWKGTCQAGVATNAAPVTCNNKLIGARYYDTGAAVEPFEFRSPRDYDGHGSHTASTAGGNHGVAATINGAPVGAISGMAPQARIAAYKALWTTPAGTASGSTSNLVAAIDDAVADGVDVINYSISGSSTYIVTADELAFLGAADAGVFVATSAGNSGDTVGASSVAHNSPWTMTVAASTHDRGVSKTLTLGNGATYQGLGVGAGVGPAPLVVSSGVGLAGADATEVRLCFPGTLDPAKVTGKIVVCDRGVNDRVAKSLAVKQAGGVGMVLANTSAAQSLNADFHSVPSIHVDNVSGAAAKAYVSTAGASATATISAVDTTPMRAPEMAGFSSYGPAIAGGGDLLKPDITAPGVDVIAAVSPAGDSGGNSFNALSGTSMSSPHIAGIAALVMQAHPTWSPMWVKSALMTTATTLDNQGKPIQRSGKDATPLDYGSGHVRPAEAFNPGVVFDSDVNDWIAYGCSIGQIQLITAAGYCDTLPAMDPSDLNYPSIAVGQLAGQQTVTRTLTNVESRASQYALSVDAPAGFTATVSPSKVTIPPGQSRSFKVTLTRTTAPFGTWAFGSLTASGNRGQTAKSPIAVKPVAAAAPAEVTIPQSGGSLTVTPGYGGTLATSVKGLAAGDVQTVPTTKPVDTTATVVIPAGTSVARFATYDADYPAGTDVDITVKRGSTVVGTSAGGTAEESVTLTNPVADTYTVTIDYFDGTPATLPVKLVSYAVPGSAAGNLTVSPANQAVTVGQPATFQLVTSGLTAGTRYLGRVDFSDGTSDVARTLVAVTP